MALKMYTQSQSFRYPPTCLLLLSWVAGRLLQLTSHKEPGDRAG